METRSELDAKGDRNVTTPTLLHQLSKRSLRNALDDADYTDQAVNAIVRAVNCHEELLEIVKMIADSPGTLRDTPHAETIRNKAWQAVAKAEGK